MKDNKSTSANKVHKRHLSTEFAVVYTIDVVEKLSWLKAILHSLSIVLSKRRF